MGVGMLCQYSRPRPVSSEKHDPAADAGAGEGSGEAAGVVPVTAVAGYRAVPESLTAITRRAKSATALRSRTCGRLYVYDPLLERLAQDLEPRTAELRPFIQVEDAVVRQRHFARRRHLAPADPLDVWDGVMRGATRAARHQGGAVAGAAGDAVDTRGGKGFRLGSW
jgi:hypothetical protein